MRARPTHAARLVVPAALAFLHLTTSLPLAAQTATAPRPGLEFQVASGALFPTGEQRNVLKRGNLTAAQLSYRLPTGLAITTTFGWARSRDIATEGDPRLDVFTYDIGVERRLNRVFSGRTISFSPLAGLGAGGRSYAYRSLDVAATHNLAAYGSAGGELGYRRLRLRVELRDYLTGFRPLAGSGTTARRNDLALLVGLRIAGR